MNLLPKILFLTEIETFPVIGGEKIRSYGLLKLLSKLDAEIIAVTNTSKTTPDLDHIRFYKFPFDRFINKKGFIVNNSRLFFYHPELINLLDQLTSTYSFDLVFIDYYFYGQYINYFRKKGIKVIYGTHNAEAKLYLQRKAVSIKNYISNKLEYFLQWLHERIYFPKADLLIAVSKNDVGYYKKFINERKICMIPNFLDKEIYQNYTSKKENYILMTANFWAFQNYYGLDWFLREVWNKELSEKVLFKIIGIGAKKFYAGLEEKYHPQNVEVYDNVEDIKPYLSKAKLAIVPLLHGSGTRLKCLEAMAIRTQLLSTSKGAEGIEHKNSVIIADTPEDFRKRIFDVLDSKIDTTNEAYSVFCHLYDLIPNKIILEGRIKEILNS